MAAFNLEKATEKVKFNLQKKGIPNVKAAVAMNLDVSGSARPLYSSNAIQRLFEAIVPFAVNFDDNGSLQVFTFSNGESNVREISPEANAQNFADYIKKNVLNGGVPLWGGTDYAPVIKKNLEALGYYKEAAASGGLFGFGAKKGAVSLGSDNGSGFPSLVVMFTDGVNSDNAATYQLLKECQDKGVKAYFLFVGVGESYNFKNIVKYGDDFDNVGFVGVEDLEKFLGSDEIYDLLLPQELVEWFKK